MASVTSLGLHLPTALPYLIQERILGLEPPSSVYKWHNTISDSDDNTVGDDELVTTETSVVWSRGGVVRKCFRFEIEEEPVTQAILTNFFPEKHDRLNIPKANSSLRSSSPSVQKGTTPEHQAPEQMDCQSTRALVVFLKTQAHVYFLSGTSHVIHLPFDVEHASVAPNGLIIQRKLQIKSMSTTALRFPLATPNSLVSSQSKPWSANSSQQSTFSIASLGSPKQLLLPQTSSMGEMWLAPAPKDDSSWPRLFSLTDPLAELGLIVTAPKTDGNRRASTKACPMDPAEEIIHVTDKHDVKSIHSDPQEPLILAVTLNRETIKYTVWRLTYVPQENHARNKNVAASGAVSRRRSSFAPGTGATTPVADNQFMFRESFGDAGIGMAKSFGRKKGDIAEDVDFAATLDPDFDSTNLPRRKSRRVSSMLARADLSASHERSVFSDLATGQQSGRRGESLGSQHTRNSLGYHAGATTHQPRSHLNHSNNSFLEAPVDDLLEELRTGGDFDGFHNMGLDDEEFEGLRKEIVFTKVGSVAAEHSNIRFSTQHKPAQSQCRVFTLAAPLCTSDNPAKNEIIICILDPQEKKLLIITLNAKKETESEHMSLNKRNKVASALKGTVAVVWGGVQHANDISDACKVTDGEVSRILILTETANGYGELTLQAPWSLLMNITLPEKLSMSNIRILGHDATPQSNREGGFKRILSQGPRALRALQNSLPGGLVDIVDEQGRAHQIRIQMEPRSSYVKTVIDVCRTVLPGSRGGENIFVGWWYVHQWLKKDSLSSQEAEWSALVVLLFSFILALDDQPPKSSFSDNHRRSRSSILRSSSGAQPVLSDFQEMLEYEAGLGATEPPWIATRGWEWLGGTIPDGSANLERQMLTRAESTERTGFIPRHVRLTRQFMASSLGQTAVGVAGFLPSAGLRTVEERNHAIIDIVLSLHLLHEEQKLVSTSAESLSTGLPTLAPVLAQICKWLDWNEWASTYDLDGAVLDDIGLDTAKIIGPLQPPGPPSIYDWIGNCQSNRKYTPPFTLADVVKNRTYSGSSNTSLADQCSALMPRTSMLVRFFSTIQPESSSTEIVEALHNAGVTHQTLESLPESILVPLRESILDCQTNPPVSWGKDLLSLVGREDVNMLLSANHKKQLIHSSLLAPTHESNIDVHTVCSANTEHEAVGAFDGSAEVERQAITRLIFKDDRRFNEAARILNTSKPTIARCESEPEWSESDLLEAQKEHAQMLAIRTLAIPTGRGLLNFSARVPLLTEKFPIGGFNLHCVMKPTNNTVGVDKNAFTEEKVCWAFFHAGVSAGLSISQEAKGIDTSWILYNKPQELSNRHAGFLLALGLNGHLKSVAKWVAFKYLTPKHTMTSIGLLLGLAASYLGTMDSLITRLLSVHVTRMLPPGAAELNLSPLTQTTGIMGIGLLYCNTQHRRMSEIMLSEIEHIDTESEDEPLRNEGYRLAAGFALGFINLGKGSDLKGLHDMRLTERLLRLAVGSKKVDLVHILDKATAGAVVAIALIFMKTEDHILARKIDVPNSALQYDYVRPDVFLLRTLARHLIMWSKIEASSTWIEKSLPEIYRSRSWLHNVHHLSTEDLPFYDILTGLCFSIALRYAGSGYVRVRDLLIHYLDQMIRICGLPALNYDQKLTRNTVRNCLDLLALSAATVMAGSGDLVVFRRLRALHGRDDKDTPYGSHLVAHLAVGVLFLGGGTHTFGTSNLAIASLLVAFYPIFPTTILDNKSHLQAFRHFWVLATEARCLVARDVDTNQPVSVPLSITLKSGDQSHAHAPCLLPELKQLTTVSTNSREYWNVVLDFEKNPKHLEVFKATQTIYVRRRPAYDASTAVFHATLQALNDASDTSLQPLDWLFYLPAFSMLTKAERALVLPPVSIGASAIRSGTEGTLVDERLILEKATLDSGKRDRLLGLKLLFEWADKQQNDGHEIQWIRKEVIDRLKAAMWMMSRDETEASV